MIVYLNLDEVIRIIREYDDAKERMMKKWRLTQIPGRGDPQHAAARFAPAGRDRHHARS